MPRLLHLLPHDLGDLLHGLIDLCILVHHDVVVLGRRGHLDRGVAHTDVELLGRLGAPLLQALLQRIERRRHDEDGQGLRQLGFDLPHPLRLGLDDDDPMVAEGVGKRVLSYAFEVAVDHRPLQKIPGLDLGTELLGLVEVVVDPLLLVRARLATGRGHVHDGVVERLHEAGDHGVLTGARRRGDDDEERFSVDAGQRICSRTAVAPIGGPRDARYAARSGASGAVKVRSPACGRRTVSRQACRNWRSSPLRSPRFPYTGSPTIGSRAYARCTRIWWVRPVSGRTWRRACRSAPPPKTAMRSKRVVASRPPARTTIRRRPSGSRRRAASPTSGASPGTRLTSASYALP